MTLHASSKLILASASPRRKDLLRLAGLTFSVIPAHVDETLLANETPRVHVRRLAFDKAFTIAQKHALPWVLGADTIVVIDEMILGKPKNKTQAREMIGRLSGRDHKVFTGYTLMQGASGKKVTRVVVSTVRFKTLSPKEIAWYIESDELYDKAGAYAAQGVGACFIRSIRGSYTNVIGLPLCEVIDDMMKLGAVQIR